MADMAKLDRCVVCGGSTDGFHCTSPTCPWPKHGACSMLDRP